MLKHNYQPAIQQICLFLLVILLDLLRWIRLSGRTVLPPGVLAQRDAIDNTIAFRIIPFRLMAPRIDGNGSALACPGTKSPLNLASDCCYSTDME